MGVTPPVSDVAWRPAWRIVPSRFPPIQLFERVADPADLDLVIELESLTNPRIRDDVGQISLVPPADRVTGPGASAIMAAFTHLNPAGSRFSDGSYGVFYAGRTLQTAIAETKHHRARFLAATAEPAIVVDMRVYQVDLKARLHDLRGRASDYPGVDDPADYGPGQALGRRLRAAGSDGVVYGSVRDPKGQCAAVFRPPVLSRCRQERHLAYAWNGVEIASVYEKRLIE